jgi:hypothetical protein
MLDILQSAGRSFEASKLITLNLIHLDCIILAVNGSTCIFTSPNLCIVG